MGVVEGVRKNNILVYSHFVKVSGLPWQPNSAHRLLCVLIFI